MTRDEVIKALDALTNKDPEITHEEADSLLRDFLASNGFQDVSDAYARAWKRVGFWFA